MVIVTYMAWKSDGKLFPSTFDFLQNSDNVVALDCHMKLLNVPTPS